MPDDSTIKLSIATKEKLKKIGNMGDTYEGVILRLIDVYNDHESNRTRT